MADGPTVAKVGNIVRDDPVLRFSIAGKPFTKFSIQVKPYVANSQEQVEPVYYDVTCFGSLAEHVAESARKGWRVGVIGTGKVETWNDKQTGEERSKKVILADFVGPDLRFINAALTEGDVPVAAVAYADDEKPF